LPLAALSFARSTTSAWLGLIFGASGIVYGLTAKRFTAYGHLSGREPERFRPTWRHRLLVVSISAIAALSSLAFLLRAK
jgi:hypothetical protein